MLRSLGRNRSSPRNMYKSLSFGLVSSRMRAGYSSNTNEKYGLWNLGKPRHVSSISYHLFVPSFPMVQSSCDGIMNARLPCQQLSHDKAPRLLCSNMCMRSKPCKPPRNKISPVTRVSHFFQSYADHGRTIFVI